MKKFEINYKEYCTRDEFINYVAKMYEDGDSLFETDGIVYWKNAFGCTLSKMNLMESTEVFVPGCSSSITVYEIIEF